MALTEEQLITFNKISDVAARMDSNERFHLRALLAGRKPHPSLSNLTTIWNALNDKDPKVSHPTKLAISYCIISSLAKHKDPTLRDAVLSEEATSLNLAREIRDNVDMNTFRALAILLSNSAIISLNLSWNDLGENEAAFNLFANALPQSNITTLHLGHNLLDKLSDESFENFCTKLKESNINCIYLQFPDLSKLTDKQFNSLCDMIENSKLISINLTIDKFNRLDDERYHQLCITINNAAPRLQSSEGMNNTDIEGFAQDAHFVEFNHYIMRNGPDVGIDKATAFTNSLIYCINSDDRLITFAKPDDQRTFDRLLLSAIDKTSGNKNIEGDVFSAPERLTALKYLLLTTQFPELAPSTPFKSTKAATIDKLWDKAITTAAVSSDLKAIICAIDPTAETTVKTVEMMPKRPGI